jgi:hypothetical protein
MQKMASIGFGLAMILCATYPGASSFASTSAPLCGEGLSRRIPQRGSEAPTGTDFVRHLSGMSDDEREFAILEQLLAGNIPGFLRHLTPVHLTGQIKEGRSADVTVCVSPDYLAVGSDQNFFLVPMRLSTALTVANRFRFALPTPRIVDAIYAQAAMRLQPQPLPASDTMRSTDYYWEHNELVQQQRANLTGVLGDLTAGDKKDLVLTNRLWTHPARVAIYGWHRQDGSPIQPLSTVHGARYADYSHGVRLVSDTVYVNGQSKSLLALLQDPHLAGAVSNEGQIRKAAQLINELTAPRTAVAADGSRPLSIAE